MLTYHFELSKLLLLYPTKKGFIIAPQYLASLQELVSQLSLPFSIVILSLKLIQRFLNSNSNTSSFSNSTINYYYLVAALTLSTKLYDDNHFSQKIWSSLSGIEIKILNRVEIELLSKLNFQLHVSEEEYSIWIMELIDFISTLEVKNDKLKNWKITRKSNGLSCLRDQFQQIYNCVSSSPTSIKS